MSQRLSGINPLSYMGVEPVTPPLLVLDNRAPTANDSQNFNLGALWLDTVTENVYMLVSLAAHVATWILLSGGSGSMVQLTGNTGVAMPVAGNINVFFDVTQGTARSTGSADNLTLTFSDADGNLFIGTAPILTTGLASVAVGVGALGLGLGSGNNNVALGTRALLNASADNNISIGFESGTSIVSGDSNILVANVGTGDPSNSIHIGTQGSGAGQQNTCFIAGITGVNVGSVANVVSIATGTGQLGTTAITAGANVTVTPGANTITISASSGGGAFTLVQTQTATTDTILTFTTGITPTFNSYWLTGSAITGDFTGGVQLLLQVSDDGGATYKTANYLTTAATTTAGMFLAGIATNATDVYTIDCYLDEFTAGTQIVTGSGFGSIYKPASGTYNANTLGIGGVYTILIAVNAFRIVRDDAGTFSGTFSLYSIAQ